MTPLSKISDNLLTNQSVSKISQLFHSLFLSPSVVTMILELLSIISVNMLCVKQQYKCSNICELPNNSNLYFII